MHGKGPQSFSELDLDISHEGEEFAPLNFFKCITLPDMYLCMAGGGTGASGNVRAFKKDLSVIYTETLLKATTLEDQFTKNCFALQDNARANRLCSTVGSNKTGLTNISTPVDWQNYFKYDMN